jgi:hypothetical protein
MRTSPPGVDKESTVSLTWVMVPRTMVSPFVVVWAGGAEAAVEAPVPAAAEDSPFEQATTNRSEPRRRIAGVIVLCMENLRKIEE